MRTEKSKGEALPKIKSKDVRVNAQNNASGLFRARLTELFLAVQFLIIVFVYASLSYLFHVFFYVSIGLTALCGVHAFISVKDAQVKASWLVLLLLSCGFGYIIYFLSSKVICFGADRRKFKAVYSRSRNFSTPYIKPQASQIVQNDCAYFYNAGGFVPFTGTNAKYFPSAVGFFDDVLQTVESAQKFIFLEFFIVADGVLLEKFISVLQRKIAEGVEVKLLYDDAGSRGLMRSDTKKRLKKAGVQIKVFSKLFTFFNFNLNFRDHRKVLVIDGKTACTCGCNIADECINEYGAKVWKDAGIRLDGAAVDEMSLMFLRQWDFVSGAQTDFKKYLGFAESLQNDSIFVPFAGGPDVGEICRGAYYNAISGAGEKLYIMSPYFVPDGEIFKLLKTKALSGVDVRLVLPQYPDWAFLYRVTLSNAESLISSGVKVYIAGGTFSHGKVMLTENCAIVGSVNMDMRSFYHEYDNAVYTNDKKLTEEVEKDFESLFSARRLQVKKRGFANALITAVLKLLSPLM